MISWWMEGGSVVGEVGVWMGDVRVLSMVDMMIEWWECTSLFWIS